MKVFSRLIVLTFFLTISFAIVLPVFSGNTVDTTATGEATENEQPKVETIANPIAYDDPRQLIGLIINIFLSIIGTGALIMFIYGGLVWLTSAGNSTKIDMGRKILIWASIGVAFVLSSYFLVNEVFKAFG